jgi:D-galacturonate reductase
MVGTSGGKFPAIREHLQKNISEAYNGLDVSFEEFPKEGKTDPNAYKTAIDALPKGSASKLQTNNRPACSSADTSSHHLYT